MKFIAVIGILALSACSYTSRDTELDIVSPPNWTATLSGAVVSFAATCADGDTLVGINRLLQSDAGAYFFLLAPIGNASVLDVPQSGLEVFVRYPHVKSICSVEDVTLDFRGNRVHPASANEASDRAASCSYNFSVPLNEAGQMTLKFRRVEGCEIPDLPINYKTGTKQHYDSIQG
jgi:hypothetical protein